ncbi:large polymerase protein [Menangle virus]|uniref:RNA-directed RNA polymerase L n=1 Tax=Menangle virus TaxID=152219 RepID=Q2Z1L2_9MONO|nr:large polymerase protein [Menangle virus]
MACPEQIILPEVHLDSPIVRNKLLYYIKVGLLPGYHDTIWNSVFPDMDWKRVRAEESRLCDRLTCVKKILTKSTLCHAHRSNGSLSQMVLRAVEWPAIIPELKSYCIPKYLSRFSEANRVLTAVLSSLVSGTETLLQNVSLKLCGKPDLLHHNERYCRNHHAHTRPKSALELSHLYQSNQYTTLFNTWFIIRHQMRSLIMKVKNNITTDLLVHIDDRNYGYIITPEIVVLYDRENGIVSYFTFEMVLMVTDMLEGRMNILVIADSSCYLHPLVPRLSYLFELVDNLCPILKQNVYSLISNLESLSYAILQLSDPVPELRGEFLSFINGEIIAILLASDSFTLEECEVVLQKILDCYTGLKPDLVAEMLCVMRLWGHPMLSSATAARKVRESMCAPKVIDLTTNLKTLAFFNGIIINGYRRKHNGMWPNCRLPPFSSVSIQELKHDNMELSYQYILSHWKEVAMIEFEKSIDADPGDDLSIFMKDKAISAPKKEWMSVFRKVFTKQICEKCHEPIPNAFNRRLLLNFLADETFDPAVELQYVTTGAYLDDEEFCASYSLKEKEIKETGRIFAKLTKKMRSCQVIAESLLASHAGKFFKENGVVLDQISITKTLLTMSQIGLISKNSRRNVRDNVNIMTPADSNTETGSTKMKDPFNSREKKPDEITELAACFLTTDLSKYCLNWRYQSIIMFATNLNKLYGYDHLFEWIHLRLMRSTLYVGDPFNPPKNITTTDLDEMENGDIFIVSPRGGIEGLCQKMWTMISIAVIVLSATEAKTRVMSLVQGDNQAMAITTLVPRSLSHSTKKTIAYQNSMEFVNRLRLNNFGMGHHLKEQETIISSEFIVYSKRIIYNGRILNQALKNVSKLCLIADVMGESTQTSCSNLSTTIMRLTENGVEKDVCFFLNQYLTAKQLVYDLLFPMTKLCEDETTECYLNNPILISRIITIPAQLGGLNFYALTRLFNRNIGDPLTSAIADVKRYVLAKMLPKWVLKNLLSRSPGDGDWNTLASDPYALNINYLYPPTTFLKKHTQRVLIEGSVNPMLRGIFGDSNLLEENNLSRFLLDREVVMPRVAHIIMEQSVCGRKKQIQGYLDTTRTIIRYALSKQPLGFHKLNKILDYNTLFLSYNLDSILKPVVNTQIKLTTSLLIQTCSIDLAKMVRRLSWSSLLGGRQLDGLETPDPIELLYGSMITSGQICDHCMAGDNKYTWLFIPAGIDIAADPADNPPIRVPYIGSRTDERRVASMSYVKGSSNSLKSALRLCGVYIWAFGDTDQNWQDAVELAQTRTEITEDQMRVLTPLPTTANLTHRLDDGLTQQKFTPASSYMFSSFVHISNDSQNLEVMDKTLDSNLIYQQIMLLGLGIIETWLQLPNELNREDLTIHLHTASSCCIKPVDPCIINEALIPIPHLSVPKFNKFVFDAAPLQDIDKITIENIQFEADISGIDTIPQADRLKVFSHLVGIQLSRTLTGLDEITSLVNDAVVEADYSANWISECLNARLDEVFIFVAWNFLLDLSYQLYYLRILGYNSILDYLSVTLSRIPGLALSGISSTISHPKILRRMINLEIIRPYNSPYLATLNYTKMSCDAILWGARHVLSMLMSGIDIEIIIPSESSSEIGDRILNLVARKLSLIACLFANHHDLPIVRGMTADQKCLALTNFLVTHIQTSAGELSGETNLLKAIHEPKLTAFPCNLFYLSRKLLNYIRDSQWVQQQILNYYDSKGFVEHHDSPLNVDNGVDNTTKTATLTALDWAVEIFNLSFPQKKNHTPLFEEEGFSSLRESAAPPTHHILRPVGLSSTSWYKGLSVVAFLRNLPIPEGGHLYLAEGSGSMMTVIESHFPAQRIYYNSLFSSGQNPPQRNFQPMPTQFVESIVYQNIQDSESVSDDQIFYPLWSGDGCQTDLTKTECTNFILSKIISYSLSLINIDFEDTRSLMSSEVHKAHINTLILAGMLLKPNGILIVKTYLTPFCRFNHLIRMTQHIFGFCHALRSSYSDPNSDEIFLILRRSDNILSPLSSDDLAAFYVNKTEQSTILTTAIMTYINENLQSQQKRVSQIIHDQILYGRCDINVDDHINLSRLGSRSQTAKILDIDKSANYNIFLDRITQLITTFFKELISLYEDTQTDRQSIIYSAYNVSTQGKISTGIDVMTKQTLDISIRNWCLIPRSSVIHLVNDLELGIYKISSILPVNLFMDTTPIRKHLIRKLGYSHIQQMYDTNFMIFLDRPTQKRIWKSVGSVILEYTLNEDTPLDGDILFPDQDDIELDIFGDEI